MPNLSAGKHKNSGLTTGYQRSVSAPRTSCEAQRRLRNMSAHQGRAAHRFRYEAYKDTVTPPVSEMERKKNASNLEFRMR